MDKFWEQFIGQFLALVAFFAFPSFQYIMLKRFTRAEGKPALWYLPDYAFRLVIRGIPGKRILSDIKYRAFLRKIIPSSSGSSVKRYEDDMLLTREDFFLFPGNDQILICFAIEGKTQDDLVFVYTDKLGKAIKKLPLSEFDILIADYSVTVENTFNFDSKIAKRVEIEKT